MQRFLAPSVFFRLRRRLLGLHATKCQKWKMSETAGGKNALGKFEKSPKFERLADFQFPHGRTQSVQSLYLTSFLYIRVAREKPR